MTSTERTAIIQDIIRMLKEMEEADKPNQNASSASAET